MQLAYVRDKTPNAERRGFPRVVQPMLGLLLALISCGDDTPQPLDGELPTDQIQTDWIPMTVPTQAQLLGVWGRTSTEAYAVGWDGTILRWDGLEWRLETSSTTVPLTDVSGVGVDPDTGEGPGGPIFATGWNGAILRRNPDGTWTGAPKTTTTSADLAGIHLTGPDEGLAVGDTGTIVEWDGTTWIDVDFLVPSEFSGELIPPRTALAGVWSERGNRWYITGAGGSSFRSSNGTRSFQLLDTLESIPLRGVWGPSRNEVFTVGLEGIVLRFTNRWRRDGSDLPDTFMFGIWGQHGDDITAVGWNGTIARRREDTWTVERSGTSIDLRDVWVDAQTGFAIAVGARGTILTRTASATASLP